MPNVWQERLYLASSIRTGLAFIPFPSMLI